MKKRLVNKPQSAGDRGRNPGELVNKELLIKSIDEAFISEVVMKQ